MSIKVALKDLGRTLRRDLKENRRAVDRAIDKAAHRGKALLVAETPVDTGQMKNAWRASEGQIHNDAPHAGIIERGARPHTVSPEGIASITRWAQRSLGLSQEEAKAVAWGVAKKLEKEGQTGKFIVEKNLPKLATYVRQEVQREFLRRGK